MAPPRLKRKLVVSVPDPPLNDLQQLYWRYQAEEQVASFVMEVGRRYTCPTLARLLESGDRVTRRGAALALGFLGDYETANRPLGRALVDGDRAVRLIAESGIRWVWFRWGEAPLRHALGRLARYNTEHRFGRVLDLAADLLDAAPELPETWNQRAIARFQIGRFEESAEDCRRTLELNPYHYLAAVGLGHCHLETGRVIPALECFRRALTLSPDLEGVRAQVEFLERSLGPS